MVGSLKQYNHHFCKLLTLVQLQQWAIVIKPVKNIHVKLILGFVTKQTSKDLT